MLFRSDDFPYTYRGSGVRISDTDDENYADYPAYKSDLDNDFWFF